MIRRVFLSTFFHKPQAFKICVFFVLYTARLAKKSVSTLSVTLRNIVAQDLIFLKKTDYKHALDSGGILGSSLKDPYS